LLEQPRANDDERPTLPALPEISRESSSRKSSPIPDPTLASKFVAQVDCDVTSGDSGIITVDTNNGSIDTETPALETSTHSANTKTPSLDIKKASISSSDSSSDSNESLDFANNCSSVSAYSLHEHALVNNVLSLEFGTRDGSNPSGKYQSSAAMSDAVGIFFLPVSTDQSLDREFDEESTIDVNDDLNEDEDELKIKMEEVLISESKMDDSDEQAEDQKSTDKDLPVGDDDAETIKSGRDYRHGQTDWEHIYGISGDEFKGLL
jgi:hypothetical protein